HLVGFTDHEIEIMALVARYHRKGMPTARHSEFAALSIEHQRVVRLLAGMLRVGIALDRAHARAVRDVRCHVGRDEVTIEAFVRPDADATLELYTAEQRKELLEDALGRSVSVKAADVP
ncbi:MAG TPA: hypothetical protein VGQ20_13585, partial [Acidimicrobiales bacterium]|nr:hypothetical protein [Acidimicrobiales bacterium]